jgi:N-methylhydantoinase A
MIVFYRVSVKELPKMVFLVLWSHCEVRRLLRGRGLARALVLSSAHPSARSGPISSASILGVDVGGTFTDFVAISEGRLTITKVLSTRPDPSSAVLEGIERLGVEQKAVISHGTTVATNALLEHDGARTALMTTRGFRDALVIGRQTRPALYQLSFPPRWSPAPDDLRFEVEERVSPDGAVLAALDADEVERVLDEVVAAGAESLAVCLLFSFANPAHERMIGERGRARGLPVSLSCEILPEFREFERASTTVLNAYVSPLMTQYVDRLAAGLVERPLWIMQSSGGILTASAAKQQAVRTLLSGPAGGALGAFHVAAQAGHPRVIGFDMGGTSTDASLIDRGVARTSEGSVEGWPVRVPMIDIHTVGAGGGSIAWIDRGGALRVGPQSAGSNPGPACYGVGGDRFSVTDANLLLGRLHEGHFLGGLMRLDRAAAERAALPLAQRLGMPLEDLAEGVIRVADARIEQALRVISVARGADPRDFALLPFGGAGPIHACSLAEALRIPRVLIPLRPGVLSALGLALADFTVDYSRTIMVRPEPERLAEAWQACRDAFAPLEQAGLDALAEEGFAAEGVGGLSTPVGCLERGLDVRYRGQSFELAVPVADGRDVGSLAGALAAFHTAHERRYGYARPDAPVEIVNVRLTARGIRPKPDFAPAPPAASPDPVGAQTGETRMRFRGRWREAAVYSRDLLEHGHELRGPALIVQEDATTVLLPGWRARVDAWLNLLAEAHNG